MEWQYIEVTYEQYLANPNPPYQSYTFDYTDIQQTGKTYINFVSIEGDTVYSDSFNILENEVARDIYLERVDNTTFLVQRKNQTPTSLLMYEYIAIDNKLNIIDFAEVAEVASFGIRTIAQNSFILCEYTKLNTGYTSIKPIKLKQGIPKNILGFSKSLASSGQGIYINNGYEIEGFEGLIKGAIYYLDDDGGLSLTEKTMPGKIGVALSDTKIKLFKQNRGA